MHKCCTSTQVRRTRRRINGLELPLNYQQVIGWIVFVFTGVVNFVILIEIQFDELKMTALIVFTVLYVSHIISHIMASYIDPGENDLRKLPINNVPEFDRSLHTHVIENGRCHLCNIYTSSKNTKHCSICNKCVDQFDHHCKWLNNCIGQRNYTSFIASVTTALFISLLTTCLSFTDIILFFVYPQKLSPSAQDFINCTSLINNSTEYCRRSTLFLVGLIIFCGIAFAIGCALVHLCCFHVYISVLGVSTYEYIMKSGTSEAKSLFECNCCRMNKFSKLYISKNKGRSDAYHSDDNQDKEHGGTTSETNLPKINSSPVSSETNVANLISVLINSELGRAKKIFLYDKNKIHPQKEESGS